MTNVLPQEARRALSASFRDRLILTGSLIFFVAAIVSALAVLPTYLVVHAEREALAPVAPDTVAGEERESRSEAARVRAIIAGVSPLITATSTVHELVAAALALKPSGISVDRIGFSTAEGLSISGTSQKREDVNAYRAALSGDTLHFSDVSVPAASLIGAVGGRFSIQVTPAQ